ncbi:MAG: xanthine dehydrogenase family protein subunit M [Acidimicrobiaceae bacterium]|nr:xanthine dehydrogenase family protein subunit M [Acidimicrobiaceae bacterium]
MKPSQFAYHAPTELEEVLDLLAQYGDDAKVLAGGQSLMPMMNFRLLSPAHIVDINRVSSLAGFSLSDAGLFIGALARHREVEVSPEVELAFPILHEGLTNVAHVQIRNRGTICGSLAHADSAAELPSIMMALDARLNIRSKGSERVALAEDFFRFHLTSDLGPGELLVSVDIPAMSKNAFGVFEEITRRKGDFALVGVAVVGSWDENGKFQECRIVCSGVAPTPLRLREAENFVTGTDLSEAVLVAVQQLVMESLVPTEDIHSSAEYRKKVTGVIVRRGLARLTGQRRVQNV